MAKLFKRPKLPEAKAPEPVPDPVVPDPVPEAVAQAPVVPSFKTTSNVARRSMAQTRSTGVRSTALSSVGRETLGA